MPPFSLLSTVCYGRLVTLGNKPLRANSVTPALPLGGWEHLIMAKNLTTKDVENVKPGTARKEIPDALLPGLYLVVQPSGAKSWAVRYRHGVKPRQLTLGPLAPTIDVAPQPESVLGGPLTPTAAPSLGRRPSHTAATGPRPALPPPA